jgi:hypothetical protein
MSAQLIEYYKGLLLAQYLDKPKAQATIGALVACATCDLVARDIEAAFDINTAVGTQLDVIGEYVGFSRRVLIQPERDYYRWVDSTLPVTCTGFTDYAGGVNQSSVFYKYSFARSSISDLEDEEYRALLKLKIVLNNSDHSLYSISNLLYDIFGLDVVCYDNEGMSISYFFTPNGQRLGLVALQQNMLPKPMGVRINGALTSEDPAALMGFTDYDNPNPGIGLLDYGSSSYDTSYWITYTDKVA